MPHRGPEKKNHLICGKCALSILHVNYLQHQRQLSNRKNYKYIKLSQGKKLKVDFQFYLHSSIEFLELHGCLVKYKIKFLLPSEGQKQTKNHANYT